MAPNTALCLLLTGAALSTIRGLPLLSALSGVGACALGAGALLSYAMVLDATYEWGSEEPARDAEEAPEDAEQPSEDAHSGEEPEGQG